MRKPRRGDEKYWTGTSKFNDMEYTSDLDEYICYLEGNQKPEVDIDDDSLSKREHVIMNEAFTMGRVYTRSGEKERPAEIHTKLIERCKAVIQAQL